VAAVFPPRRFAYALASRSSHGSSFTRLPWVTTVAAIASAAYVARDHPDRGPRLTQPALRGWLHLARRSPHPWIPPVTAGLDLTRIDLRRRPATPHVRVHGDPRHRHRRLARRRGRGRLPRPGRRRSRARSAAHLDSPGRSELLRSVRVGDDVQRAVSARRWRPAPVAVLGKRASAWSLLDPRRQGSRRGRSSPA